MDDYFSRKVFVAKTYKFIYPSDCCPYRIGNECEITGIDICKKDKKFYDDHCCKSRYFDRCTYFRDKVIKIKKNKSFYASYCCPYLVGDVCELRNVDMRAKNRDFWYATCTKTDYIKKCPHFLDKVGRIRVKVQGGTFASCPYKDGDWCKIRNINMKDRCNAFYEYSCCKSNYGKCCPHYAESMSDE